MSPERAAFSMPAKEIPFQSHFEVKSETGEKLYEVHAELGDHEIIVSRREEVRVQLIRHVEIIGPEGSDDILRRVHDRVIDAKMFLYRGEARLFSSFADREKPYVVMNGFEGVMDLLAAGHEFGHVFQEKDEPMQKAGEFYGVDRHPRTKLNSSFFPAIAKSCGYRFTEKELIDLKDLAATELRIFKLEKELAELRKSPEGPRTGEVCDLLFDNSLKREEAYISKLAHLLAMPTMILERDATARAVDLFTDIEQQTGAKILAPCLTQESTIERFPFLRSATEHVGKGLIRIDPNDCLNDGLATYEESMMPNRARR